VPAESPEIEAPKLAPRCGQQLRLLGRRDPLRVLRDGPAWAAASPYAAGANRNELPNFDGRATIRLSGGHPRGLSLPANLLAGAAGVAALIRVTEGDFRLLDRLVSQVGRVVAINGLEVMTRAVFEAAREVPVMHGVDGCGSSPVASPGGRATVATATNQHDQT
jgi:hypothetical protein